VQNIYDLEGNFTEYVVEKNNASGPFVNCGAVTATTATAELVYAIACMAMPIVAILFSLHFMQSRTVLCEN